MDNTNALYGHRSLIGFIVLGVISWFTPENLDMTLKIVTAIGAVISAIAATRYYIIATKEKQQQIKKNEGKD